MPQPLIPQMPPGPRCRAPASAVELTRIEEHRCGVSGLVVAAGEREASGSGPAGRTRARRAALGSSHEALEKELDEEKSQKKILHKGASAAESAGPAQASADVASQPNAALSFLRHLTEDQKNLSEFDKRIDFEKQLAAVYGNWIANVNDRGKSFLHGIFLFAVLGSS